MSTAAERNARPVLTVIPDQFHLLASSPQASDADPSTMKNKSSQLTLIKRLSVVSMMTDIAWSDIQKQITERPIHSDGGRTLELPPPLSLTAADDYYTAFADRHGAWWETKVGQQGTGENDFTDDLWERFSADKTASHVLFI